MVFAKKMGLGVERVFMLNGVLPFAVMEIALADVGCILTSLQWKQGSQVVPQGEEAEEYWAVTENSLSQSAIFFGSTI